MRWIKTNHVVMLGLAAGVAWLAPAPPARANTMVRHPGYEDLSAMVLYLPAAWKANSTSVLITDEDPITGADPATGTAVAANAEALDPTPPMQDLPTSAVPEPASGGFLLLGASLWLLKFRRENRLL